MWARTRSGGGGGRGEGKGVLLVRSGGVVLVRSQTQLLWPIYPCHSSRGCGGGLDELVRQSMKQREGERACMTGVGGGRGDGWGWWKADGGRVFYFVLRDYLPVTQVELSRCIVGRPCEYMPSFLRLQIGQGGLVAVMQPSVAVEDVFRSFK